MSIDNQFFSYETLEDLRISGFPVQSVPVHRKFLEDERMSETITGTYRIPKTPILWNRLMALLILCWGVCGFIWGLYDVRFPAIIFLMGSLFLFIMAAGDIFGAWFRRKIEQLQFNTIFEANWMLTPSVNSVLEDEPNQLRHKQDEPQRDPL